MSKINKAALLQSERDQANNNVSFVLKQNKLLMNKNNVLKRQNEVLEKELAALKKNVATPVIIVPAAVPVPSTTTGSQTDIAE